MIYRFRHLSSLLPVIGTLALISIAFTSCKPPSLVSEQAIPEDITLPVIRTITDNQGRTIRAKIIERRQSDLTILKLSDDSKHVFPISRLSERDRLFVESLPISERREIKSAGGTRVVDFKRDELERLKQEYRELSNEIPNVEPRSVKYRTIISQQRRMQKKIDSLQKELMEGDSLLP